MKTNLPYDTVWTNTPAQTIDEKYSAHPADAAEAEFAAHHLIAKLVYERNEARAQGEELLAAGKFALESPQLAHQHLKAAIQKYEASAKQNERQNT